MIEISKEHLEIMQERDKYKSYLMISLMVGFWLFSMATIFYIDVHNLDKAYNKSQEDLAYLTIKTIKQQSIINEIKSDSRMLEDLKNIDKEYR